ncbi:MAG: 2-dehydro-3-deoxygalactonokinase [Rhodobacterales bacterium]|nr:2-dehydro-3-deoxygalactonokinase [Rhodobacterales bacterium]
MPEDANPVRPEYVPAKLRPDDMGEIGDLPALAQADPVDVLPAEARCRLIRFLDTTKDWDGVALLQNGDMTHWVHLSAGEVVSFQSFLTGRLAAAFDVPPETRADAQAIAATMARPERLATHLRSGEISGGPAGVLGALIGAEISAARAYWLGQRVVLIGDAVMVENYNAPLVAQGVTPEIDVNAAG